MLNVLLPKRIIPLGPRDGEMKFDVLILPVGLMQFLKCYVVMGPEPEAWFLRGKITFFIYDLDETTNKSKYR